MLFNELRIVQIVEKENEILYREVKERKWCTRREKIRHRPKYQTKNTIIKIIVVPMGFSSYSHRLKALFNEMLKLSSKYYEPI